MNSKRKDLQYASVFLLAVALTFLYCSLRAIAYIVPCFVSNAAKRKAVPVGLLALLF